MTSTARLILASILAAMAIAYGVFQTASGGPASLDRALAIGALNLPAEGGDTSGLVQRILSTGLFPFVELAEPASETAESEAPMTLARVVDALNDARPAAFVRTGNDWFVLLPDAAESGFLELKEGDMLEDDWYVAEIGPTAITVQRADETWRLEAFAASESGDPE